MGKREDRVNAGASAGSATPSVNQAEPVAPLVSAAGGLGQVLERLGGLLRRGTAAPGGESAPAPAVAEPAREALTPLLYLSWRSAVSEHHGESFLATGADGALAVQEGTPAQPGRVLWRAHAALVPDSLERQGAALARALLGRAGVVSEGAAGESPAAAPSANATEPARTDRGSALGPSAEVRSRPPYVPPQPERPAARPRGVEVLTPAPQEVHVSARTSGKRLALQEASGGGARLALQSANGGLQQRFLLTPCEGGFRLSASCSPLRINAAQAHRSQGWQLIEVPSDPGFAVERTAAGDYRVRAPLSGRWLATASVRGVEVPVLDQSQGEEQASRWLVTPAPPVPRAAVLDLRSVAPHPKGEGALDLYVERGALRPLDLGGHPLAGDFLGRGSDQLLLLRVAAPRHHAELLALDEGGARALASTVIERGGWIDGWLGAGTQQLVGDFAGQGCDQLLLLHKGQRKPGAQALLLSLRDGLAAPQRLYADNYGEQRWLDGWLDPEDIHLVGDFMGLGNDQWLMMNRNPRGGRVRIVDLKGGSPRRCYTEMWGQSRLLDGWMDSGRRMLAGDFLGRGHAQVLFLNRDVSVNTGKALIVDFCRAAPPAEVCYRELWGQSDLLNPFLDEEDTAVVGDLLGCGYDQALFVARGGDGEKLLLADFHRGAPPLAAALREAWGQRPRWESLLSPSGRVLVGRFRRAPEDTGAPAQALLL